MVTVPIFRTTTYPNKYFDRASSTSRATTTSYIWAGDSLIATIEGNGTATTTRYVSQDHLNSTNVVTNASGTVVQTMDYYPYGSERIDTTTSGDVQRGFIGQYTDDAANLSYLNARYYDGTRGRFVSQDPVFLNIGDPYKLFQITRQTQDQLLSNPQALNSYNYALGNPIRFSDANGNYIGWDDLAFSAGGAAVSVTTMAIGGWLTGTKYTWEDYAGAAVGGAVAGEALLYAPVTGMGSAVIIGAGTTAIGDATTQGLKNLTGKQKGFDTKEFATQSGLGGIGGAVGAKIPLRIPSITVGQGSVNAVVNGLTTKLSNGTISSISAQSAAKMTTYSAINQLLDQLSATLGAILLQLNSIQNAQTNPSTKKR